MGTRKSRRKAGLTKIRRRPNERGLTIRKPPREGCTARKLGPALIRVGKFGRGADRICALRLGWKAAAAKKTAMAGRRYIKHLCQPFGARAARSRCSPRTLPPILLRYVTEM